MDKSITVGRMRELIKESQGQFNPVIGDGIESENKKNNENCDITILGNEERKSIHVCKRSKPSSSMVASQ